MNEIGLLLTWGDCFSRLSYLLVLLVAMVLLNIIVCPEYWRALRCEIVDRRTHSIVIGTLPRNDALVKDRGCGEQVARTGRGAQVSSFQAFFRLGAVFSNL